MPATKVQVKAAEAQILEQSKKIDFYLTDFSIELLVQKLDREELEIPPYQREFTWEPERKSRFIESILLGLPIPFIFLSELPETGKLEIVDGSQRLRTLQEFLKGELNLGPLEILSGLRGMSFHDLLESRQRKVKNRPIRGIILNEHADEQARFDIFDRINTGSKIANFAELRKGALAGPFQSLIEGLSKDALFRALAPISAQNDKLREPEELVTRFFAYSDGTDAYDERPSVFLFKYVKNMNAKMKANPSLGNKYKSRFAKTMTFVKKSFPYGFRRKPTGNFTPRTRFESIAVGCHLALRANPKLKPNPEATQAWLEDDAYHEIVTSDGANVRSKLMGRIEYVRDRLLESGT